MSSDARVFRIRLQSGRAGTFFADEAQRRSVSVKSIMYHREGAWKWKKGTEGCKGSAVFPSERPVVRWRSESVSQIFDRWLFQVRSSAGVSLWSSSRPSRTRWLVRSLSCV